MKADEKKAPEALDGRGYPATASVATRIRATIAPARRLRRHVLTAQNPAVSGR